MNMKTSTVLFLLFSIMPAALECAAPDQNDGEDSSFDYELFDLSQPRPTPAAPAAPVDHLNIITIVNETDVAICCAQQVTLAGTKQDRPFRIPQRSTHCMYDLSKIVLRVDPTSEELKKSLQNLKSLGRPVTMEDLTKEDKPRMSIKDFTRGRRTIIRIFDTSGEFERKEEVYT